MLTFETPMPTKHNAVALISGGLDSLLATRVIQQQGIHVEGINFYTGFCVEGHTHAIRNRDRGKAKRNNALWVAETLGIKLHIIDVIEEYKEVLLHPRHGYGANLNPCLDCKSFMVRKAKEWLEAHHFDFIITGEVVGQRPMSQRRDTMPVISRESGAEDRLLRPLCAQSLPPTLPEREGWVERARLYNFQGRSRKPQIALAREFGISDYAQPAGGCCFLTDASYSDKLRDLWAHRENRDYDLDDIMLLKVGRHLRPKPHFKLIVARDSGETNYLMGYRKDFTSLDCSSHAGPLALLMGAPEPSDVELAAQIVARFGQGRSAEKVTMQIRTKAGLEQTMQVTPLSAEAVEEAWYL